MSKDESRTDKETEKEGLSSRIGRTFANVLRRALIIVCLESVLVGGCFAVMYTLKVNSSSAKEYTEEIDRAMQSKVSMLEAIASGISSGTINDREDVQNYVDSMVLMDEQISAVYSCYDENITIMSGGWQPPADFIVMEREWYKGAQANSETVYISDRNLSRRRGGRRSRNGHVYGQSGFSH